MGRTTVYLADLRHTYQGVLSSDTMPLGIGFMKSVMDKVLAKKVVSQVFAYPEDLSNAIREKIPDVLMVSNYMWNEALAYRYCRLIKALNPGALVVMGGPNIPIEEERKIDFLRAKPDVDIYVTGQGDFLASEIVELFIRCGKLVKETLKHHIHSSIYKQSDSNEIICTPILPRSKDLKEIPSPWLTGVMDKFFDGKLSPLVETNRGCPFTCTFCVQGTKWYTKVNYFPLDRIREELYYIAKMIHENCPSQKVLYFADPNYGMYERDVEISTFMGETQQLYEYPLVIDATTGKNEPERIVRSMEKVSGALVLYLAVQSLDKEVLSNIKRSNIKLDAYNKMQVYIHARGMRSSSDLIFGLPGDSKKSHINSLRQLVDAGTNKVISFQALLLKGSEMEMQEERKRFGLRSKFRVLPKNFGIYEGEKVFDIDEVVVGGNHITFDDYLDVRLYHLAISIFLNSNRFVELFSILSKHGVSNWEWIECIKKSMCHKKNILRFLVDQFLNETRSELFDSPEALVAYYSEEGNFGKLMDGFAGDNVIYKYMGLGNLYYWNEVVECAIDAATKLIRHKSHSHSELLIKEFVAELKRYYKCLFICGKSTDDLFKHQEYSFTYDIPGWLKTGKLKRSQITHISFSPNPDFQQYIEGMAGIWSYGVNSFSMFIKRVNPSWFVNQQVVSRIKQGEQIQVNELC